MKRIFNTIYSRYRYFWESDPVEVREFSIVERLVYATVGILTCIVYGIIYLLFIVTCPIWCIIYLLCDNKKGKRG